MEFLNANDKSVINQLFGRIL